LAGGREERNFFRPLGRCKGGKKKKATSTKKRGGKGKKR